MFTGLLITHPLSFWLIIPLTCFILGWHTLNFTTGAPRDVDFIDVAEGDSLLWGWGVGDTVGEAVGWKGAEQGLQAQGPPQESGGHG